MYVTYRITQYFNSNQYFKSNNILKLSDLYNLSRCPHLFIYIKSPNNNLTSRLHPNSEIHNRNTRKRTNLVVLRFIGSATQSSFTYFFITEWNKLSSNIKNCESNYDFKSKLKRYYCSVYWYCVLIEISKFHLLRNCLARSGSSWSQSREVLEFEK